MSLFDSCVSCILNSPYLLARASLFLPKKISHYLLFEACQESNLVAVKKLVETWPHKELNFDFLKNSLCRQRKESFGSCLEPHEYFGIVPIFHKYASCALTVAVGVFDKLLSHATMGTPPSVEVIDLSCIHVESEDQVRALLKLANGEYPGRHWSDYLSSEDMKKTGRAQCPQLGNNPFNHRIKLCVTIGLTSESFQMLSKVSSKWFQVVIKGIGLRSLSLSPGHLVPTLSTLDLTQFCHLFLYSLPFDSVCSIIPLSAISPRLSLSLSLYSGYGSFRQILQSVRYLSALHLDVGSLVLDTVLCALSDTTCQITALTLNRLQGNTPTKQHNEKLGSCLLNLHGVLEYFRLVSWPLTSMHLEPLGLCNHLRVIAITESRTDFHNTFPFRPVHTVKEIFQMLAHTSHLEFFEWSETINMQTKDVMYLYQLLTNSLPQLRHWHVSLPYMLLSTMDLQNDEYSVIQSLLVPLLCDKTGDESCTTYRFSMNSEVFNNWICSIRTGVCFRLHTMCMPT